MTIEDKVEYKLMEQLSDRETQVLELIAQGYTNKALAVELEISLNTIQHHVHNAFEKLEALSRANAVAIAKDRGLI